MYTNKEVHLKKKISLDFIFFKLPYYNILNSKKLNKVDL